MRYDPNKLYALTGKLLTDLDRDIRLAHTLAGAGLVETRTADGLRVLSLAPDLAESSSSSTSSSSTSSYHSSTISSSIAPSSSSSMGAGTSSSIAPSSSFPPYSSVGSSFVSSGP